MSRKLLRLISALFAAMLFIAACGSDSDDGDADAAVEAGDETTSSDAESDSSDDSGSDDESSSDTGSAESQPTIAVTTNILGDVVTELVGDQADVLVVMPVGADPHDFQASAQEVDAILSADALIVNGGSFEEGLLDVIDNAVDEGLPTHEALDAVETIEYGEGGHDHGHNHDDEGHDHSDEEKDEAHSDEEGHDHDDEGHDHSDEEKDEAHSDEDGHDHDDEGHDHSDEEKDEAHSDDDGHDHSDEGHDHSDEGHDHSDEEKDEAHSDEDGHDHDDHGHSHEGDDPHFFTDPVRMADAVEGIAAFLTAEVDGLDQAALDTAVGAYLAELEALDVEVSEMVAEVPDENRVLVTNHDAFGYFADQYAFEVVGTVIPSGSTSDGTSAGELAELAEVIEDEGVPAIFAETTTSSQLAETLADEVGDIEVVELFSGSLGDEGSGAETYLGYVRTNAERISGALS